MWTHSGQNVLYMYMNTHLFGDIPQLYVFFYSVPLSIGIQFVDVGCLNNIPYLCVCVCVCNRNSHC